MTMTLLTTDRLLLRLASPAFAPAMAEFSLKNREHLAPWGPTPPDDFYEEGYWVDRFTHDVKEADAGRSFRLLFTFPDDPDMPIGWATMSMVVRGVFHAGTLGYGLGDAQQGQGLMHEGLAALVDYSFDTLNLHRIQANYVPTNVRSALVLKRLGFLVEGYAYDYLLIDGRWQDHVLTSTINRNWRG